MAQKHLTDSEAAALYGTTDSASGVKYPSVTKNNWGPDVIRVLEDLLRIAWSDLQVFETDAEDDSVGVRAGRCNLGGRTLVYAGADEAVTGLANNDTTYIWGVDDDAGGLTIASAIDGTGWPAAEHVKLAEVTLAAGVITAIVDRRKDEVLRKAAVILPMFTGDAWAVDGDGANTNGAGMVGDVTLTEQAAAYAVVDDGGVQALLSAAAAEAGYTANYQLFPDTEADDDAVYFGAAIPFAELALDMGTAATYSDDALAWEYWNGSAWTALTIAYDGTDSTAGDGLRSFQRDGAIAFVPPSDWASTTVNSQAGYWIRARLETAANLTNNPTTNSKEHELVTPADGWTSPVKGRVIAIRAIDQTTGTLHTAADVKFIVINTTTGDHSGELTFAQDKRSDRWTGLTLDVDLDDNLAVIVTQEDGTNEVINGALELTVIQPLT